MTAGILPDMKIAGLCLFFSNVFFVVFPSCVYGQSTAQIKGVIWGPQSAVMAGVTVNLLSVERARTTKTDESGKFEFLDLPLSTYELQVSQAGFTLEPAQKISFSKPVVRQISIHLRLASSKCFPKIRASYESRSDKMNLVGNIQDFSGGPVKNATLT